MERSIQTVLIDLQRMYCFRFGAARFTVWLLVSLPNTQTKRMKTHKPIWGASSLRKQTNTHARVAFNLQMPPFRSIRKYAEMVSFRFR